MTPTASGSACWPPAARTSCSSRPASSARPRCRCSASTRRSRRAARRCATTCRARTSRRRTCAPSAGAPPEQRQIDTNDPAFKARWAKVREYGIDLMKLSLKREGLADKFKVVDKDITKAEHQEAREEERQVTAIKKNLGNFAAIIGLIVIAAGVSRLHPQRAADALPVLRAQAVPAQGRVLDRAGRRRRPGPDRPRLRRAHRRHRRRRAQGRPRRDQDGHRPGVQGPGPHERDRAAAAQDRPQGHVHRPRAGRRRRAGGQAGLHDPDPRDAARRQPGRGPRACSTPTRASTCSCWSTASAAASRGAAATCATCSPASSRPTATSRASTARSRRGASSCAT